MSVEIIDWRITSCCNNTCGFCYAASDLDSIKDTQIEEAITAICSTKCGIVCITGGEPLLNPLFAIKIMMELKKHNLDIYLSTNGTNYLDHINDIEPLLTKLSLPLDGFSVETNGINGRHENSFAIVQKILSVYNNRAHKFPIKVATVLTKKNKDINHFKEIYNFLKQYKIDLWEIYQFIPESRGATHQLEYIVSDEEWADFCCELQSILYDDTNDGYFKVFFSGRKERNTAYFIVQPDTSVIIPLDTFTSSCEELTLGNLLQDDIEDILKKWKKRINKNNVSGLCDTRPLERSTQT
jgi:MoaA/NifB/PqqE/SkfB family radical SAM enzyme